MVQFITSMKDLDFPGFMDVYAEAISEAAQSKYRNDPPNLGQLFAEEDFRSYLHDCFFRVEGAFCAVLSDKGQYAAAVRFEPYRDGMLMTALETAPRCRDRGFATRLVTGTLNHLKGKKIYSHVEKSNKASLRVHEKCGFRIIDHRAVYLDGSVLPGSYTLCLDG